MFSITAPAFLVSHEIISLRFLGVRFVVYRRCVLDAVGMVQWCMAHGALYAAHGARVHGAWCMAQQWYCTQVIHGAWYTVDGTHGPWTPIL